MKSKLLAFLNEIGASPRKALSQNFLIDQTIISNIVTLADVRPGDWILEIGPGAGAITQEILARGAHVFAVEKDHLFAQHLERLQTTDRRLHIHSGDFLEFRVQHLLSFNPTWKVISNLPYQVTVPIFEVLCDHSKHFESATVVVQKEVGDRICAKPHTKTMGALTIFLQFYAEIGGSFPIASPCFFPKPAVESMCLRLNFKQNLPSIDPSFFFPIVRKAYQQRRKMLTTSLKEIYPNLATILLSLGISQKARPEDLSVTDWVSVICKLRPKTVFPELL